MKIRSILLSGLIMFALAGCESSSGGSGGLFSMGASAASSQKWDLMMILNPDSPVCPLGFPGRGAGINEAFPGGFFPGVKVTNESGMFKADVPEVKGLTYALAGGVAELVETLDALPPTVVAGDLVRVNFAYKTEADGLNGDYFLVRIVDGDRFLVVRDVRDETLAEGVWRQVSYSYRAQGNGFALWFITGLSGDPDRIQLDNLSVSVNGVTVLVDDLGVGDYTFPMPLAVAPGGGFIRIPLMPISMQGAIMGVEGEESFDGVSLGFSGGSYFTLDGMGGSSGGYSGAQLMYSEPNLMTPYYGQTQAVQMRSSYVGDYQGFETSLNPTCEERGQAIISVNPTGNADLSGYWMIQVKVTCEDPGLNFGLDQPELFGMTTVGSDLSFFSAAPFTTVLGDNVMAMVGLTLGDSGFFMIQSGVGQAVVYGAFDPSTGVFAGQVMGTLPIMGGACEITSGQFVALVGDGPPVVVP